MLLTFLTTLIAYSIKINRLDTFNNKNPLYLHVILTLQFFEGQNDQWVNQLVVKVFGISQTLRIVSLSLKNDRFFQTPFYFSFSFLDNDSHKFWDQSPSLNISVVCKYLRHFLGTSFVVATLTICCNIEYREGAWFISAK